MSQFLYLDRTIEKTIREAFRYFSVISVTGPRQSGKSTLLGHFFPHFTPFFYIPSPLRCYFGVLLLPLGEKIGLLNSSAPPVYDQRGGMLDGKQ
jgi:hypothetical protein